jgi:hypothetical protein
MHTVENVTGRLVEVRVETPLTLEEVQQFVREHRAIVSRIEGNYVGVVDLLRAHVFPTDVAQALIQILSGMAPMVERTAFLIGESAIFSLQIERVLRSSNSPQRRSFRDPEPLKSWLGEVLSAPEQARLAAFLDTAS